MAVLSVGCGVLLAALGIVLVTVNHHAVGWFFAVFGLAIAVFIAWLAPKAKRQGKM